MEKLWHTFGSWNLTAKVWRWLLFSNFASWLALTYFTLVQKSLHVVTIDIQYGGFLWSGFSGNYVCLTCRPNSTRSVVVWLSGSETRTMLIVPLFSHNWPDIRDPVLCQNWVIGHFMSVSKKFCTVRQSIHTIQFSESWDNLITRVPLFFFDRYLKSVSRPVYASLWKESLVWVIYIRRPNCNTWSRYLPLYHRASFHSSRLYN